TAKTARTFRFIKISRWEILHGALWGPGGEERNILTGGSEPMRSLAFVLLLSTCAPSCAQTPQHQTTNAGCPLVWNADQPHYDIPAEHPDAQIQMIWDEPENN